MQCAADHFNPSTTSRSGRSAAWFARVRDGLLLGLFVAGPLLVGASYRWLWPMLVWLAVAALVAHQLAMLRSGPVLWLRDGRRPDWLLVLSLAALGYVLLQSMPLPVGLLAWISPQRAADVAQSRGLLASFGETHSGWAPLSAAPGATRDHFWLALGYVAVLLLGRQLGQTAAQRPERIRRWLLALAVIAVVVALYGLWRWLLVGGRLVGTLGNANRAAAYFLMSLPLVVAARETAASVRAKRLLTAAILLVQGALLLTLSRWGIASALLAALLTVLVLSDRRRAARLGSAIALVALLLINIALLLQPLWSRYSLLFDELDLEGGGRLAIWAHTLRLFADYWLFGAGAGSYTYVFSRYEPPGLSSHYTHAHNDYLNLLADLGLVGTALVLLLVGLAVREALRGRRTASTQRRWLPAGMLAAVFGLLLHVAADFSLQVPAIALQGAFILGLAAGLGRAAGRSAGAQPTTQVLAAEPAERPVADSAQAGPRPEAAQPVKRVRSVYLTLAALLLLLTGATLALWPRQIAGTLRLAAGYDHWGARPFRPVTPQQWASRAAILTRAHAWDPADSASALAAARAWLIADELARGRTRAPAPPTWRRGNMLLRPYVRQAFSDARPYVLLGHLAQRQGRFDAAAACFAVASDRWPSNAELNWRVAYRLLEGPAGTVDAARMRLAREALQRMVRQRPRRVEPALQLLAQAAAPLEIQREVARLAPDGFIALGRLLLRRNRPVDAAAVLDEAVAVTGDREARGEALILSVAARLRTGRFSAAGTAATAALRTLPARQRRRAARRILDLYAQRRLVPVGLRHLRDLALAEPSAQAVELLPVLARAARSLQAFDEVDPVLRAALALDLRAHEFHTVADAALLLNRPQHAIDALLHCARLQQSYGLHLRLGRLYRRVGKPQLAASHLRLALRRRPGATDAMWELAHVLLRLQQRDQAKDLLARLHHRRVKRPGVYLTLCRLYIAEGRPDDARTVLEDGVRATHDKMLREELARFGSD